MPVIRRGGRQAQEDSDDESEIVQTQSRRRRRDDTEETDTSAVSDVETTADQRDNEEHKDHLARKLVRFALSCEFSRKPIKRADITKTVLGAYSRQFRDIFARAQKMLDETFGMKMEELPASEKLSLAQRRAVKENTATQASTNTWVLVTTLPIEYRKPSILGKPQSMANEKENYYMGICTAIVTLIYLHSGRLGDNRLDTLLFRRMGISTNEAIEVLVRMDKEGFIKKIVDTSTGQENIDYIVGPRGKAQIGEEGVTNFVKGVWGDDDEAEDVDTQLRKTLALTAKQSSRPKTNGSAGESSTKGRPKRRNEQDEDEVMVDAGANEGENGEDEDIDEDTDDTESDA